MSNFKNKVIYQIYPKSFNDTNHDGIGDINGIIEKLDYLKELGIDMIWMCPIFASPQRDSGYDIKDYYQIDPIFGTMDDLDHLIAEAQKRNISLMFDMVFNHTSTEHQWFQEALKGNGKYKNYYFFKKGKDGQLPTNWDSKFGGKAWKYVPEFDEYYLHLYDEKQADLNWQNEEVRNELIKVINFWLQKGIRGFRFDVINNIDKRSFEDSPDGLGKQFYCDQPKVHDYLHELNVNSFGKVNDCITVGEMSATSVENCIGYTNPANQELDMVFSFHHLKVDYVNKEKWTSMPFDFNEFKDLLHTWQVKMQEGNGWNAVFLNCHDQPRSVSRFGNDQQYRKESAKMLASTIHMMRGTPYIYQGEEIGMTNHYFTDINQYRDVESINAYHILKDKGLPEKEIHKILQEKSRDNSRTPMQWNSTINGGFSDVTPWLQVNDNYQTINVENDLNDSDSIFKYYQKLIRLRKEYQIISEGMYEPLFIDHPSIFAYKRYYQNEELIVLNNFYAEDTFIDIQGIEEYQILLSNYHEQDLKNHLKLRPYESLVLYKK
ncbi:MAG: alpha,alpha-phosphotrehalase [Longibaculum muris]|uniref:Alpha,alpha-phosphotrehalase n=1 Tax=Longibaculum muris TaxID=1796628 RepID=A0A4R3Z9B0_9FIRM|nr:alpha,alpha-phosphotrehalase [Longibaculum muris]KXU49942.1 alpha,alpha-phosphotrehalase [Candidatus Stoquefichus sp. KLE1796]MBS5368094.1 alpha,alpha-phosphotrehalase [Coprobacillus cateniformis]MCR1887506.1 alpha,alpha-phosphotrehalase [Longibaculum muris]MED9811776.1 alpha,alpha-phosphotrehalase [Longibaculum muris]TCW00777.1 trehalose-6-phosphate hydrolase [Longibaculum muris]